MSTDDRYGFGRRPTVGDVLEHPLLGLERGRTEIAIAGLLGLTALFAVSYAGSTVAVGGAPLETLTTQFDTLTKLLIALATATITILPFVYAVWNGGPLLSFAMPLVPVFLGDVAAGQYVLGVDAVIALTVGAAACALAMFATDVRQVGSLRPWTTVEIDAVSLLVVTMTVLVAAAGVAQFAAVAPPRNLEWYAPFSVLWLVPAGIVGAYWQAAVRTTVATQGDETEIES
ncbi:hypothetical protein [Natronorubrum texcoconense]|uniref:Uncharacterized protein n=1 Tax=Natronorubrum texcoconense TaxID=1095776 RepID=A0A1G9H044_9EURY|nr:hypothetical protein [Natronorubrum texcoconense]SDL06330.1 hypothetical protein SAMN04515672_0087 [Natronorubrum texcoconense]